MRRENGRVLIDISAVEFNRLLLMMGYAVGGNPDPDWWRTVNAVNEDNPQFAPFAVPPEASHGGPTAEGVKR